MPLFICEEPRLNAIEIRAKARRLKRERGLEVVVVDYLQLMGSSGQVSRYEIVSHNIEELKRIAKELDVAMVALSQLNRSLETRGRDSNKPQLSDLRESGNIEQAADVVAFIWQSNPKQKTVVDIAIAKNRNGPTGDFRLLYEKAQNRFENLLGGLGAESEG
jgi:replicative DNA helicase